MPTGDRSSASDPFSTWIGHADKNRAWDKLVAAKNAYDTHMAQNAWPKVKQKRVDKQLAICEGSDWFWWFGDENPSQSVRDFDLLYRLQLDCLYREMGIPSPEDLREPISKGGGDPAAGGVMKPGQFKAKG